MLINHAFACSNTPHSSTDTNELVGGLTRKFEQELSKMVGKVGAEALTPTRFRSLLGSLGSLLAGIGREAVAQILEDRDEPRASIEVDGHRLRYRGVSEREWLTPFGKVTVLREPCSSDSTVVIPAEFEAGGTIRGRELVCRE